MGKKKKKSKKYTGEQEAIVLPIPENTVKLKIKAVVLIGDKLKECETEMNVDEINEARMDYLLLDPDDDAFAKYVINPELKEFWEKEEADGKTCEEILDDWDKLHSL